MAAPVPAPIATPEEPERTNLAQATASQFRRQLRALTPYVWVTPLIACVDALIFVIVALRSASALDPSIAVLIQLGANYSPFTTGGGWWRLITSLFLHRDVVDLAIELFVLSAIGPLVERMVGNAGFFACFLVSGLCGSVVSLWWNGYAVTCGVAPALFGLYGIILGFLIRRETALPRLVQRQVLIGAGVFVVCRAAYSIAQHGANPAGAVGGLVGGTVFGLAVAPPLVPGNSPQRLSTFIISCATATSLVALGFFAAPRRLDPNAEFARLESLETRVIQDYDDALTASRKGKISPVQFADQLNETIIPPWEAERDRLRTIKGLPPPQQRRFDAVTKYFQDRSDGWEHMRHALLTSNVKEAADAEKEEEEAQQALQAFAHESPVAEPTPR